MPDPKWKGIFEIWNGGLGVWGGILFGTLVGVWIVRRSGASGTLMMDAAAPGLLLAQGIGRIGNYFNQELYGKPTRSAVGPRDRQPAAAVLRAQDLPPDVPLRADLGRRRRLPADLGRPPLEDLAAGAVRAVRELLLLRALLRGAAARRPRARVGPAAAERVGLDRALRRLDLRSSSGGRCSGTAAPNGATSRRAATNGRGAVCRGPAVTGRRARRRWLCRRGASEATVSLRADGGDPRR